MRELAAEIAMAVPRQVVQIALVADAFQPQRSEADSAVSGSHYEGTEHARMRQKPSVLMRRLIKVLVWAR
jgi:hypothetical protein